MTGRPDLWDQITDFDTLRRATRRAARGKRDRLLVARFLSRREPEILQLQRELQAGTYHPGPPFEFTIADPKERRIAAAPFRDRVVHHAVMDVLAPRFERRMIGASFACRTGKGTHAAVAHAERMVRRFGWFLKLDIHHCFETLDHQVVRAALGRVVRHPRVLELADRILAAGAPHGCGLPIGALTSQWLANLVLDRVDHFVTEVLRAPGYVRYMDDFVLFAEQKEALRGWLPAVRHFVHQHLRLALKDRATILGPRHVGLPYLGWRIYPHLRRLRPENVRRTRRRLRERRDQLVQGTISEQTYADAVGSVAAHLAHGNTLRLRRDWFFGPGRATALAPPG